MADTKSCEVKADNPNYKGQKSPSGPYLSPQGSSGKPSIGSVATPQTGTGGKPGGMIKPFGSK